MRIALSPCRNLQGYCLKKLQSVQMRLSDILYKVFEPNNSGTGVETIHEHCRKSGAVYPNQIHPPDFRCIPCHSCFRKCRNYRQHEQIVSPTAACSCQSTRHHHLERFYVHAPPVQAGQNKAPGKGHRVCSMRCEVFLQFLSRTLLRAFCLYNRLRLYLGCV